MNARQAVVSLLAVAACGDNANVVQPDAPHAAMPDAGFAEAPHIAAPRVQSGGGPTLASPKIQPIFYSGDTAMETQIDAPSTGFFAQLAASSYWTATTSEYGVGALQILPTIVETQATPPTTDQALQQYLAAHLDGTHPGWTYDRQTIYAVFLPQGVSLDAGFGKSCTDFGGYHDEAKGQGGVSIVYALLPRCQGGIDSLTAATSHECIEAATDPYVNTNLAYGNVDAAHAAWAALTGGEVGDMCELVETAYQRIVGGFVVQRSWSNAAAAAGHDPCVPSPPTPYLGATPELLESTFIPLPGVWTQGAALPLGATKTFPVELFTDAPATDPFWVSAQDLIGGTNPTVTFQWDKQYGNNGDKLHVTMTRTANGPSFFGGTVVEFAISDASGATVSQWWSFVSN